MDSNTSLPTPEQYRTLVKRLQSSNFLLNKQLQHICLVNGLRTSGVKAELQRRILDGKFHVPSAQALPKRSVCLALLGVTWQLGHRVVLHLAATRLRGEMGSRSSRLEADSAPRTALERAYSSGDPRAYRDIEASIQREKNGGLPAPHEALQSPLPGPNSAQSLSPNMNYGYQNGYPGYGGVNGQRSHQMPPQGMFMSGPSVPRPDRVLSVQGFHFKPSPFYQVVGRIGQVHTCEGKSPAQVPPRILSLLTAGAVMQNHRNCTNIQIKAQDNPLLARCVTEKDMRVFVFCAAGNQGPQDIAFPHQSELKVNGGDVKANLRGLKNKPGSTRPVDITDLLRLKIPNYANNIEFTYALTQKASDQASQSNVQVRRTRLRPALTSSRVKVATLCANSCLSTLRDSILWSTSARRLLWTASYGPSLAKGSQKPPSCTNVSTA